MASSKNKKPAKKIVAKKPIKKAVAKKPIKKNAIKKIAEKAALRVIPARVIPKKVRISPAFQPLLAKLQRRRNEITGQVNHLEQDLREDIADNQNMPGDSADHGSGELNQHLSVTLMENDRVELERIERAILRIESGAYGECETCEKTIPMPRLKAIPWATRCITCQSQVEGA
jgi:RNA polymerase-binding protein DksA